MSQPTTARPPRSVGAMAAALLVVVVLVVAVVAFRQAGEEPAETPSVDWAAWVKAGRAEQQLMLFAPTALPKGWRATSVDYSGGTGVHWHLGLLTSSGKYVGVEESRASTKDLVEQYVDEEAVAGKDVTVAGQTWQTWTDSGGDYALVRSIAVGGSAYESVLVVGSAAPETIREFAASLTAGTVKAAG